MESGFSALCINELIWSTPKNMQFTAYIYCGNEKYIMQYIYIAESVLNPAMYLFLLVWVPGCCLVSLLRDPAAIHIPCHAAHLTCRIRAHEYRQRTQLFWCDEFAGRLFFCQQSFLGGIV